MRDSGLDVFEVEVVDLSNGAHIPVEEITVTDNDDVRMQSNLPQL